MDLSSQQDKILLVAGGGGGCYNGTNTNTSGIVDPNSERTIWGDGGYGGGTSGGTGTGASGAGGGYGGTQTDGGATITASEMNDGRYNPTPGSFGKGGNGNSTTAVGYSANNGGGGGSGFYGGGGASPNRGHAGYHTNTCYRGGGGGSGFVNTALNTANIQFLSSDVLTAGNQAMPDPSNSSATIIGNLGNGMIKITYQG